MVTMYGQHDSIADTYTLIQNRFVTTDITDELKEWAADELDAIQEDLDLVTREREGYVDFLLTFIGREHQRYQLDTAERSPYDSVRKAPLCTCDDLGCELKRGQLPLRVREADSIGRGIQLFKQEHNGDPIVLDHEGDPPGGRQVWSQKRADVWRVLRRLQTYFIKERDYPPGHEDAEPGETDTSAGETPAGAD